MNAMGTGTWYVLPRVQGILLSLTSSRNINFKKISTSNPVLTVFSGADSSRLN